MNVLLIGFSIFVFILISFFIIKGITKGATFLLKGQNTGPLRSSWVPLQVYSGDDSLGHPDLQKISELHEVSGLNEGTENI